MSVSPIYAYVVSANNCAGQNVKKIIGYSRRCKKRKRRIKRLLFIVFIYFIVDKYQYFVNIIIYCIE